MFIMIAYMEYPFKATTGVRLLFPDFGLSAPLLTLILAVVNRYGA